jgi:hypothetical protein
MTSIEGPKDDHREAGERRLQAAHRRLRVLAIALVVDDIAPEPRVRRARDQRPAEGLGAMMLDLHALAVGGYAASHANAPVSVGTPRRWHCAWTSSGHGKK